MRVDPARPLPVRAGVAAAATWHQPSDVAGFGAGL